MPDYEHERKERRERPAGPTPTMPPMNLGLYAAMNQYLRKRGLDPALARANRWYPSSKAGDAYPRVVIPATNSHRTVFWQARALGDQGPRYQSPPAPRLDSIVIVWPDAAVFEPHEKKRAAIFEGPMDALAAAMCGWVGVALMGKNPTTRVYAHLARTLAGYDAVHAIPDADSIASAAEWSLRLAARGVHAPILLLDVGHSDFASISPALRERCLP